MCVMSKFLDKIIERAKTDKQKIVLPEGSDIRTVQAARAILEPALPTSSSSVRKARSRPMAST